MKLDPVLSKAARFARSGNYEGAMRTLEPEVNRYHGSFSYYYILGVSCLHSGDFGGALTYFRLAREVKIRDPLAILGMAVLYLRRGETDRAIAYYLEVQDLDEKNRTAKRALKIIKKYSGDETFLSWLESGKLHTLYPPIPFAGFSWKKTAVIASAALIAVSVCFGLLVKSRVLPNPFPHRKGRTQLAEFTLNREDRNQPVQTEGSYRYILTRVQVLDTYEKALSLFTSYRDEAAKINVNRVLESNAAEGIKNKSRILLSYTETPGFDSFRRDDNITYSDAIKDPPLFRDVHIIWRGMASNVETVQDITRFDFLVGYDTRKTLEGIVPVEFDRALNVSADRPLEVLGRIVPLGTGGIKLEGVAIHQSGRLETEAAVE